MLCHTYYDNALKFIKSYSDDAEVNSLVYDRYEEELTARYFRNFLRTAWEVSKEEPESTSIPSWNRVVFGLPDIYPKLLEAVEADNS
jgi:glucosyl-3-phosphoglycerate synthase